MTTCGTKCSVASTAGSRDGTSPASLHLSRKTVAKVLAEHRQQRRQGTTGLPKPRKGRGSVVDAYESTLRDFLSRYPDMTVVRLLEEVRARGYTGGYTVLRQRMKQLRQAVPPAARGAFRDGAWGPSPDGLGDLHDRLQPGRPPQGEPLQLRAGLFPATVHPLHRFPGLGDHAPRARAGLRAPSGAPPRPASTTT